MEAPTSTTNLEAWFINRDAGRVGNTLWTEVSNSTSTPGPMKLGWMNVDPMDAGSDDDIVNAIVQQQAWIAVVSK